MANEQRIREDTAPRARGQDRFVELLTSGCSFAEALVREQKESKNVQEADTRRLLDTQLSRKLTETERQVLMAAADVDGTTDDFKKRLAACVTLEDGLHLTEQEQQRQQQRARYVPDYPFYQIQKYLRYERADG